MLIHILAATAMLQTQVIDRALLEAAVRPVLDSKRIPGVVIAVTRGDSVVAIEAFGVRDIATAAPMRTGDLFMIGSLTKQLTATLLAQLVEQGAIGLDEPVRKYLDPTKQLPEWTGRVTVRQLATHTAGVPREPVNRRDLPNTPSVMVPYSRAELYQGLAQTRLEAEPGTQWGYSNLGYAILGEVVERVAGRGYETLLKERVFTPLGMSNSGVTVAKADAARFPSGYWPEDSTPRAPWVIGEVASFSGVHSSAADLARFVIAQTAIAPPGPFSPTLRSLLHTALPGITVAPGRTMALGWFVEIVPGIGRLLGGGGEVDSFSGALAIMEGKRTGIVVLSNRGGDAAESIVRAVMVKVLPIAAAGR